MTRMYRPGIETIELVGPTETFDEHMAFARPDGALHANYCGPAHCDGDLVCMARAEHPRGLSLSQARLNQSFTRVQVSPWQMKPMQPFRLRPPPSSATTPL